MVNAKWAAANEAFMVAFVKALNRANEEYKATGKSWTPDSPQTKAMAKWTKADYWGVAGFFTNVAYSYKDKGLYDEAKPNLSRGRFIDAEAKGRLSPAKFLLGVAPPPPAESGRKVFADWLEPLLRERLFT